MINLLDYTRQGLKDYFSSLGEKSFHGEQVFKWLHQHGVTDFEQMTNLPKTLRQHLAATAEIKTPEVAHEAISEDGTIKWMLRLDDGNAIETVYIPESGRGTLCVSSQVGCSLNCSFCSTGQQGFNRNLTTAEIIGQVWFAVRRLSEKNKFHDRKVTNVVMMGMGEPLLNFDNVINAMTMMMDDNGYNLSKYRVTLSTSGLVPVMEQLADTINVSLALSLHAPNNALRDELVPINKKYPLEVLIPLCKDYFVRQNEPRREITMEYVMLDGINDSVAQAKQLEKLLIGVPCKINLIQLNPFPKTQYQRLSYAAI